MQPPSQPPWWAGLSGHDVIPEIIYDDHDHDHHHYHDEAPPSTTTVPPPPPPPETEAPPPPEGEARVKKYSYYYLGRKIWYIPLYFTLWFCIYVAALIIRSIGRHKVNVNSFKCIRNYIKFHYRLSTPILIKREAFTTYHTEKLWKRLPKWRTLLWHKLRTLKINTCSLNFYCLIKNKRIKN